MMRARSGYGWVGWAVLTWLLAGCGVFGRASGPPPPVMLAPAGPQEIDLVSTSHAIADGLIAELRKNVPSYHPTKPLLMTTFVGLRDLDSSTELGMLLAEQVSSRFTQHGYAIVETRLRGDLSIQPLRGEFILSRELDKLSRQHQAYSVIVGNYTQTRGSLFLTAKIVQLQSRQVLASVDAKLPMEPNTRELLIETSKVPSLRVVDR